MNHQYIHVGLVTNACNEVNKKLLQLELPTFLNNSITFSLIEKYLLLSPKNQKVAITYIQIRNMIRLHKNNKYKTHTDSKCFFRAVTIEYHFPARVLITEIQISKGLV